MFCHALTFAGPEGMFEHEADRPCAHTSPNWTLLYANNTGADQPAYPCSLVSAFVIRYLESRVIKLFPCKISIF